jgi:cytidylate kinase
LEARQNINVAIDGPAGAGKSTVARTVANKLGFIYVDTGAMYRAVTWKVIRSGLHPEQAEEIAAMAEQMDIRLVPGIEGQQVFVDDTDVTEEIRSPEVNRLVSMIAQIPEIRRLLVRKQQEMASRKGVVMDGRDIGTHVLPDAEVKIFLTASAEERAKRRLEEMRGKHPDLTLEQLKQDIKIRDRMDEQRAISPLVKADDAFLLDSTHKSISDVAEEIIGICRTKLGEGK